MGSSSRHVVTDRAVRPDLVVVSAPSLQLFARIRKIHEPVGIQAFCPQLAVERLNEAVVGGFPRSEEVQCDTVGIGPQIQVAGDELAAVIDPDRLRVGPCVECIPLGPLLLMRDSSRAISGTCAKVGAAAAGKRAHEAPRRVVPDACTPTIASAARGTKGPVRGAHHLRLCWRRC